MTVAALLALLGSASPKPAGASAEMLKAYDATYDAAHSPFADRRLLDSFEWTIDPKTRVLFLATAALPAQGEDDGTDGPSWSLVAISREGAAWHAGPELSIDGEGVTQEPGNLWRVEARSGNDGEGFNLAVAYYQLFQGTFTQVFHGDLAETNGSGYPTKVDRLAVSRPASSWPGFPGLRLTTRTERCEDADSTCSNTQTSNLFCWNGKAYASSRSARGCLVKATAASSHLAPPPRGPADAYDADRAVDGDPTTAWVEGVKGPGIGEWIQFDFERPAPSGAPGRGAMVSQDASAKIELNPSTPLRATGETRCAAPCPGERAVDDLGGSHPALTDLVLELEEHVEMRRGTGAEITVAGDEAVTSGAPGRGVMVSQDASAKIELNPSTPLTATGETRCAAPCPGEREVDDMGGGQPSRWR